jgi:catechol 2,3-dioxygenase-like lactoylglutathione lyase family enzyme
MTVAVVRYLVDDPDTAAAFYVEALGFKVERRIGRAFTFVSRDDLVLWLSGPDTSAARPMPNGDVPSPGGWNRLVIEVDDLDVAVERLRAVGARFRNEPISGPGGRQVLVEDPAGNPIEIFQLA